MKTLTHKILNAEQRLLLIFSLPFLSIMTAGILQFSYGLIPFGLFGAILITIGGLLLGVVAVAVETRTKTKINRWLFLVSLLTFCSIVAFFIIARIQGAVTDKRAQQIIEAIESYHSDYTQYPKKIESITNGYFDKVPTTAYGIFRQDFKYVIIAPDEYQLYYYSYIGVEHRYDSTSKEWVVDD